LELANQILARPFEILDRLGQITVAIPTLFARRVPIKGVELRVVLSEDLGNASVIPGDGVDRVREVLES
jgi:hypothetical protein